MAESTLPKPRRRPLARLATAAAALAVLWLAVDRYVAWRERFVELTDLARELGVAERRTGLVESMRRDAAATPAALRLARVILADELDRRWIEDLPEAERAAERRRGLERLDVAHRLGVEALGERPGSWEALLVLGGAEYLRMSRRRDGRLLQERELWLTPLEEAHRLAPQQPEPLRFLAATDLGNWSVLSPEEREKATRRLRRAFEDPTTFDLLSAAWLRVAPSLEAALALVPDEIWAWQGLMRHYARQGDWERYCDAQRRASGVAHAFYHRRLDEAAGRLRWGDREKGLRRLLWVAANARPDRANVDVIERVLAMMPPGTGGGATAGWLDAWLDWTLEHCTDPAGCALRADSLRRLASLNRDLPPERRAWALAAAGSLRQAEAVERAHREKGLPLDADWTPYVTFKARLLADLGESDEALELLDGVPVGGRDSIRYWRSYRAVARAAGDTLATATAEAWLDIKARERWRPEDWERERGLAKLEILAAEAAPGLLLELEGGAGDRGVLAVAWDGARIDVMPAAGTSSLELSTPVSAGGRHLLEIRAEEGASTPAAAARLLPRPG